MSFYEITDSSLLYVLVALGILYVCFLAITFMRKAWKRGAEIGIDKKELMNVVKSSITFSIVPSIAIVIGLFSLVAMLGVPWPWFRLSVVGSVAYEIITADAALKVAGTELATADASTFILMMYVMSLAIMGGLVAAFFIPEKMMKGTMKMKEKDERWGILGNSTFLLAIMVVLLLPMILGGGVQLLTWITSLVVTLTLGIIIKKFKVDWLSNFVLALSLFIAMASSVMWTSFLA